MKKFVVLFFIGTTYVGSKKFDTLEDAVAAKESSDYNCMMFQEV